MRNSKKPDSDNSEPREVLPVARDYVAEVQERAQRLAKKTGSQAAQAGDAAPRPHNQGVQEQMAQLRSEAVHARRLAEQVETVSLDDGPRQGTPSMNDKTHRDAIAKPQNKSDGPHTGAGSGARLAFNPLHPSMELPPEQLIRLLSLETKKTRRKESRPSRKSSRATSGQSVRREGSATTEQPPARMRAQRNYATVAQVESEKRRGSLFLPALAVGMVVGLAASAYVFWSQPVPVSTDATLASPATGTRQDDTAQARTALPDTGAAASKQPAEPARTASPQSRPAHTAAAAQPSAADEATPQTNQQAGRKAAIKAERERLRGEAEQRFAELLKQSESGVLPAEPVMASEPGPDTDRGSVSATGQQAPGHSGAAGLEPASVPIAGPETKAPVSEAAPQPTTLPAAEADVEPAATAPALEPALAPVPVPQPQPDPVVQDAPPADASDVLPRPEQESAESILDAPPETTGIVLADPLPAEAVEVVPAPPAPAGEAEGSEATPIPPLGAAPPAPEAAAVSNRPPEELAEATSPVEATAPQREANTGNPATAADQSETPLF
jgi:hypothetical protein